MISQPKPLTLLAVTNPDLSMSVFIDQVLTTVFLAAILLSLAVMMISFIWQLHKQTNQSRRWVSKETKSGKVYWKPKTK